MTTIAIKPRMPTKLEMAKAIAERRADAYSLDELVEIAAEIEYDAIMRMPLVSVRREFAQLSEEPS